MSQPIEQKKEAIATPAKEAVKTPPVVTPPPVNAPTAAATPAKV